MRRREFLALALLAEELEAKRRARSKEHAQRRAPAPHRPAPELDPRDTFSPQQLTRPPVVEPLDALLNAQDPPATTLTHELFGKRVEERLPHSRERVAAGQYVLAAVPSDMVVFFDEYRPIAAFRLPEGAYTRQAWLASGIDERRMLMVKVGQRIADRIKEDAKRKGTDVAEVPFRVGHADNLVRAIRRYSMYAPYFERIAKAQGLDPRSPMIAFHESTFRNDVVSEKGAEGHFQLLRTTAHEQGLHVPMAWHKGRLEPMAMGGSKSQVDEILHPILAAEAAMRTLAAYSRKYKSNLWGLNVYCTGPDVMDEMREFFKKNPSWNGKRGPDLGKLATELYFDGKKNPVEIDGMSLIGWIEESFKDSWAPHELLELAQIMRWEWRHPDNTTRYKGRSSSYVPMVLAYMSAVKLDPLARHFAASRVTMRYRKDAKAARSAPLRGYQAAAVFKSLASFAELNPHIPLQAAIPDGCNIFLPVGGVREFYAGHPTLIPGNVREYRDGMITEHAA